MQTHTLKRVPLFRGDWTTRIFFHLKKMHKKNAKKNARSDTCVTWACMYIAGDRIWRRKKRPGDTVVVFPT